MKKNIEWHRQSLEDKTNRLTRKWELKVELEREIVILSKDKEFYSLQIKIAQMNNINAFDRKTFLTFPAKKVDSIKKTS